MYYIQIILNLMLILGSSTCKYEPRHLAANRLSASHDNVKMSAGF